MVTGDEESAFKDCLDKLDRRRAERRIKEIMDILAIAEEEDEEKLNALMREQAELQKIYFK